jgi:branched-chain amino acid transport system substrate-binding protein
VALRAQGRELIAGVSLALTGPLALQGRESLNGLELWVAHVERMAGLVVDPSEPPRRLRLVVLDDGSQRSRARENVVRLLDEHEVDLLLGPYGSGLVFAVAPMADERGRILWNHGGTADALWQGGFRYLVSVASPASDYFRLLPAVLRRDDPRLARIVVLHSGSGAFAPAVARGVVEGAAAAGCEPVRCIAFTLPLSYVEGLIDRACRDAPGLIVAVGNFADDVAIVRHRDRLPASTRLAVVAAGLDAFAREVGAAAEGVIGTSQWEPDDAEAPHTGPASDWFVAEYRRAFRRSPSYVAAQAYAMGIIVGECARRTRSFDDDALLSVAKDLDTTTFFGAFALEPSTLRQVGHRVGLIEWRHGRKVSLTS